MQGVGTIIGIGIGIGFGIGIGARVEVASLWAGLVGIIIGILQTDKGRECVEQVLRVCSVCPGTEKYHSGFML